MTQDSQWAIHNRLAEILEERFLLLKQKIVQVALIGADGGCSFQRLSRYPHLALTEFDVDMSYFDTEVSKKSRWLPFQKKRNIKLLESWNTPLNKTYDLLWSNLALMRSSVPINQVVEAWAKSLAPGGVLCMTYLGIDTAKELIEFLKKQGVTCAIPQLYDMHDLADEFFGLYFADVVTDVEKINLSYQHMASLKKDLINLGLWQTMQLDIDKNNLCQILEKGLSDNELADISLEVIYVHAIRNRQLSENSSVIQFVEKKYKN